MLMMSRRFAHVVFAVMRSYRVIHIMDCRELQSWPGVSVLFWGLLRTMAPCRLISHQLLWDPQGKASWIMHEEMSSSVNLPA